MSKNPYPIFTVSGKEKTTELLMKIRMFIRLYSRHQAVYIADAVVNHICALLAHTHFNESAEERCQYRALEMHWRCLAWSARH